MGIVTDYYDFKDLYFERFHTYQGCPTLADYTFVWMVVHKKYDAQKNTTAIENFRRLTWHQQPVV